MHKLRLSSFKNKFKAFGTLGSFLETDVYSFDLFLTVPKSVHCIYAKRNGHSGRLGSYKEGNNLTVFHFWTRLPLHPKS